MYIYLFNEIYFCDFEHRVLVWEQKLGVVLFYFLSLFKTIFLEKDKFFDHWAKMSCIVKRSEYFSINIKKVSFVEMS